MGWIEIIKRDITTTEQRKELVVIFGKEYSYEALRMIFLPGLLAMLIVVAYMVGKWEVLETVKAAGYLSQTGTYDPQTGKTMLFSLYADMNGALHWHCIYKGTELPCKDDTQSWVSIEYQNKTTNYGFDEIFKNQTMNK